MPLELLLCASDAGGGRNLAAFLQYLHEFSITDVNPTLISSDANREYFSRFNNLKSIPRVADRASADKLLGSGDFSAVLTGTTGGPSAERYLIQAARPRKIPTLSILDEWYNYSIRFQDESGGFNDLPDLVCCQDELARAECVAERIPASHLAITGNPHLAALTRTARTFASSPPPCPPRLLEILEQPFDRVVTFISETHAQDYGATPGSSGPLGAYLGYTEHSTAREVKAVLDQLGGRTLVVEKLHPASSDQEQMDIPSEGIAWIRVRHADPWSILWRSDYVVGMSSMLLLESQILGLPAVSFQPGLLQKDRCTAHRLGLIPRLCTAQELERFFVEQERCERREPGSVREFPFADPSSPLKILELIQQKIREFNT